MKEKKLVMECAACLKEFTAAREDAKTCGPRCRQAYSRAMRHLRRHNAELLGRRVKPTIPDELVTIPPTAPE